MNPAVARMDQMEGSRPRLSLTSSVTRAWVHSRKPSRLWLCLCSNRCEAISFNTHAPHLYHCTSTCSSGRSTRRVGCTWQTQYGSTLLERASQFVTCENGLNTLHRKPLFLLLENEEVMRIAHRLREQDILVGAIRPPTVPEGTARLRISLSLAHSEADIDRAIELITRAVHA